jgi:protein phosphatase
VRTAAKVLIPLLLVAALGFGAWYGARQVYFLGTDEGGRVALYRGLPYDLPFGLELYSEIHSVPVQVASLEEPQQDSVTDHELRSRSDAVSLLEFLQDSATSRSARDQQSQRRDRTRPRAGNRQRGGSD